MPCAWHQAFVSANPLLRLSSTSNPVPCAASHRMAEAGFAMDSAGWRMRPCLRKGCSQRILPRLSAQNIAVNCVLVGTRLQSYTIEGDYSMTRARAPRNRNKTHRQSETLRLLPLKRSPMFIRVHLVCPLLLMQQPAEGATRRTTRAEAAGSHLVRNDRKTNRVALRERSLRLAAELGRSCHLTKVPETFLTTVSVIHHLDWARCCAGW